MGSMNDDIITQLNIYYFRSHCINFWAASVRSLIWPHNCRLCVYSPDGTFSI